MLEDEVLEKLVFFSNEEIDNLNGLNKIDRSIFTSPTSDIIDYHKLLKENEQIAIRKHVRFCDYPMHSHNYLELIYVYNGSLTHYINGKEVVQHKGEFILLNQYVEHGTKFADENDIIFNFIIKPDFLTYLSQLIDDGNELSNFLFNSLYSYKNTGSYLIFTVGECQDLQQLTEDIIQTKYSASLHKDVSAKLQVGLLLVKLMEYPERTIASSADSGDVTMMNMVYKYIHTEYREGSLAKLCEITHQSDYQLCKFIKKNTNKTFKDLIKEERLEQSANLLIHSTLSIMEVMDSVGYDNTTYFYRIFKERFGLTPKEYRKENVVLSTNF